MLGIAFGPKRYGLIGGDGGGGWWCAGVGGEAGGVRASGTGDCAGCVDREGCVAGGAEWPDHFRVWRLVFVFRFIIWCDGIIS